MGTTLKRALPYPDGPTAENNPPADFKALAEATDAELGRMALRQAAGVAGWAGAPSAVKHTYAVTFPAGRFNVPPIVTTGLVGGTDLMENLVCYAHSVTTLGCTVVLYHDDGTAFTPGASRFVHWTATQMTPTTAAG